MKRALVTIAVLTALTATANAADPEALAKSKQCFSCHALERETHAPPFKLLARNYGGIPNADYILERKVRWGGLGHWGSEPMPAAGPRPAVSEEEAKELVAWILRL
ncbi:MAG: c-type cytochrome [Burkholderiaceae bacterium]